MATFRSNIYGPLDEGTVILQLLQLEVFTQRNFVADFIRLKLNLFQNNKISLFEPPFGGLGSNVCSTLSIARWKAHGRLPICHN